MKCMNMLFQIISMPSLFFLYIILFSLPFNHEESRKYDFVKFKFQSWAVCTRRASAPLRHNCWAFTISVAAPHIHYSELPHHIHLTASLLLAKCHCHVGAVVQKLAKSGSALHYSPSLPCFLI